MAIGLATALGALSAGASAVGSLASVGTGIYGAITGNKRAQENYELQKETADKNYQLQMDTLNYQKDLQKQIFAREDTAMQRQVEDNKKAGLSPLANITGSNAGSAVSVTAPQHDVPQFDINAVNSANANLTGTLQSFGSNALAISANELNRANIEQQIAMSKAQLKVFNEYGAKAEQAKINNLEAQNDAIKADSAYKDWNKAFAEKQFNASEKHISKAEADSDRKYLLEKALNSAQINGMLKDQSLKDLDVEYNHLRNAIAKIDHNDSIAIDKALEAFVVKQASKTKDKHGRKMVTDDDIAFKKMIYKKLMSVDPSVLGKAVNLVK